MRRRFAIAGAGIAAVLVTATAAMSGSMGAAAGGSAAQPYKMVMAEADDRLPSVTATDWVTYADHVVVVSAASEQRLQPTQTELERGEGLIGRAVDLRVKEVVWSREGAPKPAPDGWTYNAAGFAFNDGNVTEAVPMAVHDRPRIEAGHDYIMAIVWEEARCSDGDEPEPGKWWGLGEGSEVPYDGSVIGQGEQEGQVQTVADARTLAAQAGPNTGVEEEMAGDNAAALAARLKATAPGEKRVEAEAAQTSCG
ncbi:hypothetical protein AB0L53_51435 [Nonomuraea sp. NPDC052129]|uniref:hypothetical protein n=1 Tax=Nonomuraea sp. NPDC052129 TaxID=3154651 RepID=UPI00343A7CF9